MRYKKLIEIDIDLLTQCLIRTKDNKIVKTEVKEINTQYYNFKDWEFNWVEESKKRNKILGLFAENDKRLQGIVEYYENKERQLLEVLLVEIAPFNNRHNPKNILKSKENPLFDSRHKGEIYYIASYLFAKFVFLQQQRFFSSYDYTLRFYIIMVVRILMLKKIEVPKFDSKEIDKENKKMKTQDMYNWSP